MQNEAILSRIKKLLGLSTSSNVNEAGAAAAEAQRLMLKHKIDVAEVTAQAGVKAEPVVDQVLDEGTGARRTVTWRSTLAGVIADAFNSSIYSHYASDKLSIIGRTSDAQTVRYLLGYLAMEIERLCVLEWKKLIQEFEQGYYGTLQPPRVVAWKNRFRDGAVAAIDLKLRAGRKETEKKLLEDPNKSKALAIVKKDELAVKAEIEAISEKLNLRKSTVSRSGPADAFQSGHRAGSNINIGDARGALGPSSKRIGGK